MSKRKASLEIYKAKDGWRWRLNAANEKLIAEGGEAYKTKSGIKRAAAMLTSKFAEGFNNMVIP